MSIEGQSAASAAPSAPPAPHASPGLNGPGSPGVLEIARFDVRPGSEDAFLAAYRKARLEIVTTPGCRSVRMTRGVESPSSFILLAEWDTIEAHLETFRGSSRFVRWRAAIGPHLAGAAKVEHVTSAEVHGGADDGDLNAADG